MLLFSLDNELFEDGVCVVFIGFVNAYSRAWNIKGNEQMFSG
jgi:hypothetical protein